MPNNANEGVLQRMLAGIRGDIAKREKVALTDKLLASAGIQKKELDVTELTVSKELAERLNAQKMTEEDVAEMADAQATAVTETLNELGLLNDDNREQVRGAIGQAIARMMMQMSDDADMLDMAETNAMDEDEMDDDKALEEVRKELIAMRQAQNDNYGSIVKDFGDIATVLIALPEALKALQDIAEASKKDTQSAVKQLGMRIAVMEKAFSQRPKRASEAPETVVSDSDDLLQSNKESLRRQYSERWGINLNGE